MSRLVFTIGLATLVGAPVLGQVPAATSVAPKPEGEKVAPRTEAAAPKKVATINRVSTFVGSAVKSADGRPVGKVQDLVFDLERGEVSYAVVALNESVGRMRVVAVPTRALKAEDGNLVLNISEAVLAAAEGLQDGDWPGMDAFAVGRPAQAESGTASSNAEKK